MHSCLQIGLGIVLLPPIIAAITLILKNTGPLVAIYLWFFILVVSIFMMTIYPVAIAPLFNKFTPLPEGSLRCGPLVCLTLSHSTATSCHPVSHSCSFCDL